MQHWNGVIMYAPHTPDRYAIPGMTHCIFRLMHQHGDTQAWNLYWLSKPQTDSLLAHRNNWFRHYDSLSPEQTEAFYEALDAVVLNTMTLATVVAQPPREAMRLLERARLDRTRFYTMAGGEAWRTLMMGRLFTAARNSGDSRAMPGRNADVVTLDFSQASGRSLKGSGTSG
ncbi:MAG: hypothetical protein REI94_12200 [Moraxellaceae bacterium]|nr:hypothetical protein [Moraxellaceae bacterium]